MRDAFRTRGASTQVAWAGTNRKAWAVMVIAAGAVAGLIGWGLANLVGFEFIAEMDGEETQVAAADVIIASIVGGLIGWVVHTLMAMRGWAARWWPFVGSTALAISMIGASYMAADSESAMGLMVLHFLVGVTLIWGFAQLSPAHVPDESRRGGHATES